MPYIDAKETKAIKKALQERFPHYRFSVRREHYSTVRVSVMAGPIDLPNYEQVNHYYIERDYDGAAKNLLTDIKKTIKEVKDQHTIVVDGDYGAVPNYYLSINIGRWDKPYEKIMWL